MDEGKGGWQQFDKLQFDRKRLSRTVRRASGVTNRHAHRYIINRLDSVRHARKQILAWVAVISLLILAVATQLIMFRQNYIVKSPARGGTYAEASIGPIDTLNPLYAVTPAEATASRLLFSSLFNYDATGHLVGDAAATTKVSEDGKKYQVELKPNIYWHDGEVLSADDVVFTINLIKNPQTRSPLRINWRDVTARVVNDRTVEFTLPASYAAFGDALTFPILPKHLLEKVGPSALRENPFSRSPVGSGPFAFKLLQAADAVHKQKVIHLIAHDNYYAGRPLLNRFEVHVYNSYDEVTKALRINEVSGAQVSTMKDAQGLSAQQYNISTVPINSGMYAMFSAKNDILKQIEIRRALQAATDTKAIREALGGHVTPLSTPFIPAQVSGVSLPPVASYNLTQADALLEQAGWQKQPDGVRAKAGVPLKFTITTTKNQQTTQVGTLLKDQWKKAGVDVALNSIDTSQPNANFWQDVLQPRNYDILLYELLIGGDPDVYAYWHSSQIGANGYNFASYTNKTADAALASARSLATPELRSEKYALFARQWAEDIPALPLYQQSMVYVSAKSTTSVVSSHRHVSAIDRFSNILYWSVEKDTVYKTP